MLGQELPLQSWCSQGKRDDKFMKFCSLTSALDSPGSTWDASGSSLGRHTRVEMADWIRLVLFAVNVHCRAVKGRPSRQLTGWVSPRVDA